MLDDITAAKEYVLLETYKYGNDSIGRKFRDVLVKKAKEGVKVKVLIDSWGSSVGHSFFSELAEYGGEVRFFTKIKFFLDFFTKNHRRNHRKFIVIDDRITYVGSANINTYSMNWMELELRIEGDIARSFRKVFNLDFKLYNKYFFERNEYIRLIRHDGFEIIRDVPSIAKKRINKKFIQLIRNARESVYIETPYFLPGFMLRRAMIEAAQRGVDVTVITPRKSDVGLVDILRNKYLGPLHEEGVRFRFFAPGNLHAKSFLADDEIFGIGSPNFDYRSFRYMHEILLVGKEQEVINQLKKHLEVVIQSSIPFEYVDWTNRPRFQRFVEWLLLPFRHLL
jgi:cardiolipin synthase